MNYLAVGDIHGRFDLLEQLLAKAAEQYPTHQLVFLGDMVDRGRDAFKVVERIKKLTEEGKAIALLGNHEDMMLDYVRNKIVDKQHIWKMTCNGGQKTIESYGREMKMYGQGKFFGAVISSGHYKWLSELPLYHETDEVWFSHAPIPDWRDAMPRDFRVDKEMLTWTYLEDDIEGDAAYNHNKTAVCGHIHAIRRDVYVPRVYPKIIYADTGCGCYDKAPLTGVVITGGQYEGYIQASAQ